MNSDELIKISPYEYEQIKNLIIRYKRIAAYRWSWYLSCFYFIGMALFRAFRGFQNADKLEPTA